MRRRGYTPESIRNFSDRIGVTKVDGTIDVSLLEYSVREHLNRAAQRVMGVLDPLKVIITNYPENVTEEMDAINNPEDLDINVTSDSISIKGIRHRDKEIKDHDYFYQECYWGRFSRSIILPQEIDPDRAAVKSKNGILTIKLPKLNKKKVKKLKVKLN